VHLDHEWLDRARLHSRPPVIRCHEPVLALTLIQRLGLGQEPVTYRVSVVDLVYCNDKSIYLIGVPQIVVCQYVSDRGELSPKLPRCRVWCRVKQPVSNVRPWICLRALVGCPFLDLSEVLSSV
jgi:hypothetical protein